MKEREREENKKVKIKYTGGGVNYTEYSIEE